MYILAIESSCDETSVSIIKDGREEISTVYFVTNGYACELWWGSS